METAVPAAMDVTAPPVVEAATPAPAGAAEEAVEAKDCGSAQTPSTSAGDESAESSPASFSFVATSNQHALKASRLKGETAPVRDIILASKTTAEAFKAKETTPRRGWLGSWLFGSGGPSPGTERAAPPGPPPKIVRSSGDEEAEALTAPWGLVSAVVEAYNRHHELVLRPDDVWQAILTQFSFYVNRHAEALRDRFVDFKGQKTLVVKMGGDLFSANFDVFAHRMVNENILTHIKDSSVVDWLLPGFSTTTWTDRVAASVTLMSTLQAYFDFVCSLCCGIPKVTLLGTPEDWKLLRGKVDRLKQYNLAEGHMTAWHRLLAPVLDEFVKSAEGNPSLDFWDRVCSHHGGGSGPSYLSGWVTVFAVFSHKGLWQGTPSVPSELRGDASEPSPWPFVDFDRLPVGAVSVPVLVDDNGTQYDTQMLAGQFSYEACDKKGVALRPRTDWCLAYTGFPRATPRAYQHGEIRQGS